MATKLQAVTSEAQADVFVEVANEIENLDIAQCHAQAGELISSVHGDEFRIGALLTRIEESNDFAGFESFEGLLNNLGMKYRKARYLITNYQRVIELGIPWTLVQPLGWTKLRILSPILDAENYEELLTSAADKNCAELTAFVKSFKESGDVKEAKKISDGLSTFSLKMHPDQKDSVANAIDKAMEDEETTYASVALEAIALKYLSQGEAEPAPQQHDVEAPEVVAENFLQDSGKTELAAQIFAKLGLERVGEIFEQAFPHLLLEASHIEPEEGAE